MRYLLAAALIFLASCSTYKVVRNCHEVDEDDLYVCKTLKFWE